MVLWEIVVHAVQHEVKPSLPDPRPEVVERVTMQDVFGQSAQSGARQARKKSDRRQKRRAMQARIDADGEQGAAARK